MSEKLKPCPFCGGENIEIVDGYLGLFAAQCNGNGRKLNDFCCTSIWGYETKEEATAAWNMRPDIRLGTIEECKRVFTGLYEGSPIVRIQIERALEALAEIQPSELK